MATRTIKAKVELDGEKEYKKALQELNTGNKELASEMRKLQAEYKGNTESTEFLTKKGELLERQLLQQRDKVETLRKAVQASAEKYGEASTETQNWMIKLNNAEAEEYDLQHAIEENNGALQGQGEEMAGLGDTVDKLGQKLGISLPENAKKALNGMGSFSTETVAKLGAVAAAVAAVTAAVKKMHEMTLEAAKGVDEIITESMTTGLSTRQIQQFKYAENLIDVSYSTITSTLTKLTKNMADARDGNANLAAAFASLGVSIEDASTGQLRPAIDVFYDCVDALGAVENSTERDAITMELMGKSAQDLNPLIIQGSDALRELADEAEATGYVLDESQIKKLGEVDDAYQRMQLTVEATKKQLAADFAPASESAMDLFSKAVQKGADVLDRSGIIENLGSILASLADIIGDVLDMTGSIPGLDSALTGLKVTLGAVAQFCALIADAADLIKSIVTLDFGGVKNALGFGYSKGNPNHYQTVYMQQSGKYEEYKAWTPSYNASGNDNWRGGLTWLHEGGPEIVDLPQGSRIYSAQESREMVGGDTFIINVARVDEIDEVVDWFKSRRIRGRM